MLEALSKLIRSQYPKELPYAVDLALVSETLKGSERETGSLKESIGVKRVRSKY